MSPLCRVPLQCRTSTRASHSTTCVQTSQRTMGAVCRRESQALAHLPGSQVFKAFTIYKASQRTEQVFPATAGLLVPQGCSQLNLHFRKCNLNHILAGWLQASWCPRALSSCMGPGAASSHPLDGSGVPQSGDSHITGQATCLHDQHRSTSCTHADPYPPSAHPGLVFWGLEAGPHAPPCCRPGLAHPSTRRNMPG